MAARTDPDHGALMPVVTLFGQVGAGTQAVARRVAAGLGLPYHPQAFSSDSIAGAAGGSAEERAMLAKVIEVLGAAFGAPQHVDERQVAMLRDELVADNTRLVRAYAADGGVIVGRNAALILGDRPLTLHVLLTGEEGERHRRAADEMGLALEHAATRARREDQVRADMSLVLHEWDPRAADRYDLVIDTTRVTVPATVAAIVAAVRALTEAADEPSTS